MTGWTPLVLGLVLLGWIVGDAGRCAAAERPNVVLVISDDQAYSDFGFMGNGVVQTPNLDDLAARSARFRTGYVPASVCRPSLATLLTGLYPHEHGVHFNHPPPGFAKLTRTYNRRQFDAARRAATHLIRDVDTLPRLLAAAGYRCLQTGKYWEGHWRNAGFTAGMTTAQPQPGARYGNKRLANGEVVAHGNGDAGLAIGRETMRPIKRFLEEGGERPFLIWYAPFLPHLPHDSPRRFFDRYDPSLPEHLRAYYAACSQFDESVGDLRRLVESHAPDRPTLWVFVSDNGYRPDPDKPMRDGHGFNYTRRSKRSPFEDGLRTPILFAWKDQTVSADHQAPVSSVSIVPTILEACGLDVPAQIRARSLWRVAAGERSLRPGRPVFGEVYPGDASALGHPAGDVAYRWVRRGRYKLIVPHLRGGRAWGDYVDEVQLYDVVADPGERQNLAGRPDLEAKRDELRAWLDQWWSPRDNG